MSVSQKANPMTEAVISALCVAYPDRGRAKRIARDHGVSPAAVKKWLAFGPPAARLDRLIGAMQRQIERRLGELAQAEDTVAELRRAAAHDRGGG